MWNSHFLHLLRFLLIIFSTITTNNLVTSTDHIVGANRGWNPGINYTLWSNNQTFYVGDLISFRYVKNQYNVFEVNQTGYDNCTLDSAVGNWSKGKDFIPLNKAKRYYFICGTGGCFNGMKVSIVVHPLPSPPSTSTSTTHHLSQKSAAPAAAASWLSSSVLISGGSALMMASIAWIWL